MNIMMLFDYIFFRVADFYTNAFKSNNGEALGALLVTLMQGFHIVAILIIVAFFSNEVNAMFVTNEGKNSMHSYASVLAIIVLAFNFYRYFKIKNYDDLRKKWAFEDKATKTRKGTLIMVYIIFNLLITVGLSIYRKYYF